MPDLIALMPTSGWGCLLVLIVWLIVVLVIYSVVVMAGMGDDDAPSPGE